MSTTTQIGLTPAGQLFLELPGKDGQPRQINLAEGQAEKILKLLLRQQRETPAVGRDAGATWRFLLEADLLEALARHPVSQVPMGVSRQSKTQASPEELGL